MTMPNALETAIMQEFDASNTRITDFDGRFREARDFVELWGEERLRIYRQKVDEDSVATVIDDYARNARNEISARMRGQRLNVELVLNSNNGVQLYAPVRHAAPNQTFIEAELMAHLFAAFRTFDPAATIGRIGRYTAIGGNGNDVDALAQLISEMPEAMRLSNVSALVHRVSIPLAGTFTQEARHIDITITQSAIDYRLIPIHRENQNFFPHYKTPFVLETQNGAIRAWVTSRIEGSESGNYLTSTGDGALPRVFEAMRMAVQDTVRITEMVPFQHYRLDKL